MIDIVLYVKNYFFVLSKIIRNFICKHGKNAKVVKTKVLQIHSTGPRNSTTTTAFITAATIATTTIKRLTNTFIECRGRVIYSGSRSGSTAR